MKTSSLIGHVVELLGEFSDTTLPADALIGTYFRDRRYLGSRDRRFISETFYGVLRHRMLCDHILGQSAVPLENITPEGLSFFRTAAYLLILDRSDHVSLKDLFAFLGPDQEDPRFASVLPPIASYDAHTIEELSPDLRWSFPVWMVEAFRKEVGEEALPLLLEALNAQAPLAIRVNRLRTTVDQCRLRLEKEGLKTTGTRLSPDGLLISKRINAFSLDSFRDGWFEVQDDGSQLLIALADPKPTDRVLDLCAGAGGKTLAMSAWMKNRGEIVAADISVRRLKELRKRMRRAGADNIRVREDFLDDRRGDLFDIVFVDAPCTGVGTIRRNPGMKWTVTETMVSELAMKQSDILHTASSCVRPGGLLVYATCSLFRAENEGVVERFLTEHREYQGEDRERRVGEDGRVFKGSMVRLVPHEHGSDGFFCAFLRRSVEG